MNNNLQNIIENFEKSDRLVLDRTEIFSNEIKIEIVLN